MQDSRIPVSVITGFLGAGKTTLLNRMLRHERLRRAAVVINEFGEIGVDHDLVERGSEDGGVVELRGGCLCCTVRGDLARTLRGLNLRRVKGEVPDFDRLVVETTGLADPAPILQTLIRDPVLEHEFRLDGVVTVVDAAAGMSTLDAQEEAVKQAAVADRIVLTKVDLAAPEALGPLRARLARLNPGAAVVEAAMGEVDPGLLLDAGPYDPTTKTAEVERWLAADAYGGDGHAGHARDPNRHDARIRAFCLRRSEPVPGAAVDLFLDLLLAQRGADLLRVKGLVHVAETPERPLVLHAVQHVVHAPVELAAWPSADRDTRLVFVVRDVERRGIERLLDALAAPSPDA